MWGVPGRELVLTIVCSVPYKRPYFHVIDSGQLCHKYQTQAWSAFWGFRSWKEKGAEDPGKELVLTTRFSPCKHPYIHATSFEASISTIQDSVVVFCLFVFEQSYQNRGFDIVNRVRALQRRNWQNLRFRQI